MRSWGGVRGGTPIGTKSLCSTCSHAQIIKGEAGSEQVTLCNQISFYAAKPVPFNVVTDCNKYNEEGRASKFDMEKTAYIIATDPRGKPIGFVNNQQYRKDHGLSNDDSLR